MADTAGKRKVTVKIRSENKELVDNGRLAEYDIAAADYTFYPNSTDAGTYKVKDSDTMRIPAPTKPRFPNWYYEYGPVTYKQGLIGASICGKMFNPVRDNSAFNTALDAVLGTGISIGDASALRSLQDKVILDSSTNTYLSLIHI